MRCGNLEEVMAFIEQVFDDNVCKLETDVTLSFEARGDYPDPDDMDAMLDEQRAQKPAWLAAMRETITALRVDREPSAGHYTSGDCVNGGEGPMTPSRLADQPSDPLTRTCTAVFEN